MGSTNSLTQERLKEVLHYDPETGIFTWLLPVNRRIVKGARAGTYRGGYINIQLYGKFYGAHRLAWLYMTGEFPEKLIDHEDLNRSNNRFSNLREATDSQNRMNALASCTNTSGVKGVSWDKTRQKWHGRLKKEGVRYHVGFFDNKEKAAEAVRLKREELHGEFANHG